MSLYIQGTQYRYRYTYTKVRAVTFLNRLGTDRQHNQVRLGNGHEYDKGTGSRDNLLDFFHQSYPSGLTRDRYFTKILNFDKFSRYQST
jgi:hypothetical protein